MEEKVKLQVKLTTLLTANVFIDTLVKFHR